jgi:DNA-binding CsgD family transcriptional regulator
VLAVIELAAGAMGRLDAIALLAPWVLYARVGQTAVHLVGVGQLHVLVRASFWSVQLVLFIWMLLKLLAWLLQDKARNGQIRRRVLKCLLRAHGPAPSPWGNAAQYPPFFQLSKVLPGSPQCDNRANVGHIPSVHCEEFSMPASYLDPAAVLAAQKDLRMRLLDRRGSISWGSGRDLAAQLLLHIDDASACWQLAVEWLRTALDVERVDGGYATPAQATYVLGKAEARSDSLETGSVAGMVIDNRDPGLLRLWASSRPVVFPDIAQENRLHSDLRKQLSDVGTLSKIAVPLRERGTPFGLLCVDHVKRRIDWTGEQYERFQSLSAEVLGPILWTSARLVTHGCASASEHTFGNLTPAESRVAMLAATGMSYKEIARKLNRSFSTVDHQLRSIRRKLGVPSCTRLAQVLAARNSASP